jgi:hypothetical protein
MKPRAASGRLRPVSFSFTTYFETKVLDKRPYLARAMCIRVVRDPVRVELQSDAQRVRFWAGVPELNGRVLRVVTLADRTTIHNAFPDRRFRP